MKKRSLGITLSYLNTVLSMVFGLLVSSLTLRLLGDVEYGLYQTVTAFATYLVMLEFGTGTVMQRNILISKRNGNSSLVQRTMSTIWYATLGLALLIIISSSAFYLNLGKVFSQTMTFEQARYAQKIFIFVIGYIIATFLTQALNGLLTGMENYTFTQKINVMKVIVRSCLIIVAVFFVRYAIVIAMVDLLMNTTCLIATYLYCKKSYRVRFSIKEVDMSVIKDALPLCLALMLQSCIQLANNSVDRTIIGMTMSMQAVAIYSVAQYIYHVFVSVGIAPITMFLPQIEKDLAADLNPKEFTRTLEPSCRLTALLCGTILGGFFAVGEQFISLVYGESRKEAWLYALILLVPTFFNQTNFVIVNILDLTKKRLVRSVVLGIATTLNVALTILFVARWGIVGAVSATAIAFVLEMIAMNIYYSKSLHIRIGQLFFHSYKGILPFQILASVAAFFLARQIPNVLWSFLIGGSLYVLLAASLILLFGLDSHEKEMMNRFKSKLIKGK